MKLPTSVISSADRCVLRDNKTTVFSKNKLLYQRTLINDTAEEEIYHYYIRGQQYLKIYRIDNTECRCLQDFTEDGSSVFSFNKVFEKLEESNKLVYFKAIYKNYSFLQEYFYTADAVAYKHSVYDDYKTVILQDIIDLPANTTVGFDYQRDHIKTTLRSASGEVLVSSKQEFRAEEFTSNKEFTRNVLSPAVVEYSELYRFSYSYSAIIKDLKVPYCRCSGDFEGLLVKAEDVSEIRKAAIRSLDLPYNSRVLSNFINNTITYTQAASQSKVLRARHSTRYEDLLSLGYTKEEAREAVSSEVQAKLSQPFC